MTAVEQYLKPDVIRQIARLDLRAQFIVKGFLQGLHASPFHGFSVEFSEHRKYTAGDDPQDIDWLVYAKTDKYYIKKFEAETNITGYLVMDLSRSMGYSYRQQMTKFDYGICLAAALRYLMIHQQDPVGLITFDDKIRQSLPPRSKRTQLGNVLSLLANLKPSGQTDIAKSLTQIATMLRHRSLVMLFSDLLAEPDGVIAALRRLRHRGHDVILFHILDEAETNFPFDGMIEFEEPETHEKLQIDAGTFRADYLSELQAFCDRYRRECFQNGVDYVPVDTSMQFDRALTGYLGQPAVEALNDISARGPAGRNRGDCRADRAASDHAQAASALGVSGAAVHQTARKRQQTADAVSALAAVGAALRAAGAVGLGAGAAQHCGPGSVGGSGSAGGRGAGFRHQSPHAISPTESDAVGSCPGDGCLAVGSVAQRERSGRG